MELGHERSVSRRRFLGTSAVGAGVGLAWLAGGRAPAFAEKRELAFLSWNHFVPAADDELRAMEWAHTQVVAALKGQLKPAG